MKPTFAVVLYSKISSHHISISADKEKKKEKKGRKKEKEKKKKGRKKEKKERAADSSFSDIFHKLHSPTSI